MRNCLFFFILHLFTSLWNFASVETRVWGVFQNCIIYDFGRILNSPAVLFKMREHIGPEDFLD